MSEVQSSIVHLPLLWTRAKYALTRRIEGAKEGLFTAKCEILMRKSAYETHMQKRKDLSFYNYFGNCPPEGMPLHTNEELAFLRQPIPSPPYASDEERNLKLVSVLHGFCKPSAYGL